MKMFLLLLCVAVSLAACKTTNPYDQFTQGWEMALGRPRAKWTSKERAAYLAALQKFHEEQLAETRHRQVMDRLDDIDRKTAPTPVYPQVTGSIYH